MPLPIPKLDNATFQELFEESRALIPRYLQEWTQHNASDPGVTFIDLFSWLAEMQIYYLDRVTDTHFLKFLKLLGEAPRPATAAQAALTFSAEQTPISFGKGTKVAAINPENGERIVFETTESITITDLTLAKIFSQSGIRKTDYSDANRSGIFFLPFGENPRIGDAFYLGFDAKNDFPGGRTRLTIAVFDLPSNPSENSENEPKKIHSSAELAWEYWDGTQWQSFSVEDKTAAFAHSGCIYFKNPGIERTNAPWPGKARYWVRAIVKTPGYEIPPRLDTIRLHTVNATHGEMIEDTIFSSSGLPFQSFQLDHPPVLANSLQGLLVWNDEKNAYWTEVADFDTSGPEDRHYRLDSTKGIISFGDGIHGAVPPAGTDNIYIKKYRSGGGEKGNLAGVGTINEILVKNLPKNISVSNARPASGGQEAESLDEAKSRVRQSLKQPMRAITTADYEMLAKATPGLEIARVKALPGYHPEFPAVRLPGAITIVILPESNAAVPAPSPGFLKTIRECLQPKILLATNLHVIGPAFVPVNVRAEIRTDPQQGIETVRSNVVAALNRFFDPFSGGVDGSGWPFGRSVFRSEVIQQIAVVKGVICVDELSISAENCGSANDNEIHLRKIGLTISGNHQISIRQ